MAGQAPGNPGKQSVGPSEGLEAILGLVAFYLKKNIRIKGSA